MVLSVARWSGGRAYGFVYKKSRCRVTHPTRTSSTSVPSPDPSPLLESSPCQVGVRSTGGNADGGYVSTSFSIVEVLPPAFPLVNRDQGRLSSLTGFSISKKSPLGNCGFYLNQYFIKLAMGDSKLQFLVLPPTPPPGFS